MKAAKLWSWFAFGLAVIYFFVPLIGTFEFSLRARRGVYSFDAYRNVLGDPQFVATFTYSVAMAHFTIVLGVLIVAPTAFWVRLKLPGLSRIVEFICLLPLTIPAIVLVVGLFPVYIWMGSNFSDSILTLSLAYVVLVLPYCYRALDAGLGAIDVKTLSEAARSLGASWFAVMWRIIVPNISNAILNATLLSVALVLGEFTIANNLLYANLQVELVHLGRANAGVSIAVAVASLLFAFVLLVILAFIGNRPRRVRPELATALAGPLAASQT